MGFEKTMTIRIKEELIEKNRPVPAMEWFNGTLYADAATEVEAKIIKNIIQDLTGFKVIQSILKANATEPWDQYAYDITDKKLEVK